MENKIVDVFGLKAPLPYKSKNNPDKTANDGLMVGLELEVENLLPNGADWYAIHAGRFWSVIEDGSLRPRGLAWEFISKPAELGVALAELRLLVEKMKWNDNNYSDRCSVHVHTNVLDFTQEQVANLALVYPVVEAVLFRFVNHYKKKEEQGYCRDTNLYCIPWSDCRMNKNFIEKFFTNPTVFQPDRRGLGVRQWEKYTALNFSPISSQGTVEWRHMHGTADMEKLSIWLNIIGSIMKFCKEQEFNDIVKSIKILNDISTYQQFFNAVLGGTLEYKEEYRAPMAEGVINAKYSLINWEANKGKEKPAKKAKINTTFYDWDWRDVGDEVRVTPQEAEVQPRPGARFGRWDRVANLDTIPFPDLEAQRQPEQPPQQTPAEIVRRANRQAHEQALREQAARILRRR